MYPIIEEVAVLLEYANLRSMYSPADGKFSKKKYFIAGLNLLHTSK